MIASSLFFGAFAFAVAFFEWRHYETKRNVDSGMPGDFFLLCGSLLCSKKTSCPEIPYESVPNLLKLPADLYSGRGGRCGGEF